LTAAGSAVALQALQAGAVEVLEKPAGSRSVIEDHHRLVEVVKAASQAKLGCRRAPEPPRAPGIHLKPALLSQRAGVGGLDNRKLILIGASTGGTEALRAILRELDNDLPGICIVQHIPALFSRAFAQHLNEVCRLEVREAKNGDIVTPGLALIAPGGYHLLLSRHERSSEVRLGEGPKIHYQRPAVDVLFGSAVKAGASLHTLAILLTGMGSDGAQSMLELRQAGASTIAQDEASCVVFGMPREAIRLGAAQTVAALDRIPAHIEQFAQAKPHRSAEPAIG
jgi:two-component system chemotaxis response regulator CheB